MALYVQHFRLLANGGDFPLYLMFFISSLPYQGTAAGGTTEIVVNGTTGFLHLVGKEGVSPLANNIVKLATHVERRLTMGKRGYQRVKERFLEHHMARRISTVLREVLAKSKSQAHGSAL